MSETKTNDFLPPDYTPPETGAYLRLEKGENRIRILSRPIIGWLDWTTENGKRKPLRYRMNAKPEFPSGDQPIKHFWAMVVWSYAKSAVCIWEVTQASIQHAIKNYADDADWGNPQEYDLKINKSGDGMGTEYAVIACPAKPCAPEIAEAYIAKPVSLEALYDGKDPFKEGLPF